MTLKSIIPVLFLFALAACAGTGAAWVKEGASEDQVRADQTACRRSVERATARSENVTQDIRSADRGGRSDTRAVVESTRDYKAARNYDRLFARCMRGLGYTHPKT